jgi:hypothetical protein
MNVIDWLLASDPAIGWQVLRDLSGASSEEVRAQRALVEQEGWGARLLALEDADGGWNCEAERGSVRSSFDTTINVLDGLLEFERATGRSDAITEARLSGQEYLLERDLLRRKSSGEIIKPDYLDFAFPYYWHYDVLRALDYFRRAGAKPDPRMAEAVELVRSKRQPDGRWLVDRVHPGRVHFAMDGERWNTLRALRVLDWWDRVS